MCCLLYTSKGESSVTLPIVTTEGKLEGIITIKDIVNAYMEIYDQGILATAKTPYSNLIETLDGQLINGNPDSIIEKGRILVGAGNPEIMEEYIEPKDIVIVSNRSDAQICACLLYTSTNKLRRKILSYDAAARLRFKQTVRHTTDSFRASIFALTISELITLYGG